MSRQQREHPRYAHEAAITIIAGSSSVDSSSVEGRTNNLSRGGLCATLERDVPMGTDVDLEIVLVFDDDVRSEGLRLPARVVWVTAVDEGHQVGISFRPLDAERSEYLGMFIKYLDQGTAHERSPRDLAVDDRFR